jgi:hypothetical protein
MSTVAKTYIAAVIAAGSLLLLFAAKSWSPVGLAHFGAFLGITLLASACKIRIPGMTGTMSPNFVFLIVAIVSLPFSQTIGAALGAALVQSYWRVQNRPRVVQVVFSAAALVSSAAAAFAASHLLFPSANSGNLVAHVFLAGAVYMSMNSALVSIVVSLAERRDLSEIAHRCYECVFPYFAFGIIVTALLTGSFSPATAWRTSLQVAPAMFLAYLYFLGRSRKQVAIRLTNREEEVLAVASIER